MENRVDDIGSYVFKPTDQLLVDANVWLVIYGPQKPASRKVAVYSGAFYRMLEARCPIYIDVLILSEIVNRYARFQYNITRASSATTVDFKQFRKDPAFKPAARAIAADVRRILKYCARLDSGFHALDIHALVDEYEKDDSDFNDQVLIELCKSKSLTLVTDDGDFTDRGLTIITANRSLLDKRP
jgi:hypothetical protein